MNRRNFIKSTTVATGTIILPFSGISQDNKPIKIAVVGTGWWGTDTLIGTMLTMPNFEIIGLCDINSVNMNRASEAIIKAGKTKPSLFTEFEKMYDMPELQAVAIASPTHWHALHFIAACKKGLHVFLEKPISYDIREGQAMLKAHQLAKNVVQVDFPRVIANTNNEVRDYIRSGAVGKILQIQANINNPEGIPIEKKIPSTIDFEMFCGPAPKTKYLCGESSNNPQWRDQHDFSRGIMSDWGIHYIHNIRKVMGLALPDSISAIGGTTKNIGNENPDYLEVQYLYGALPVIWSHKSWGYISPNPNYDIGVYYFGEKATIFAGDLGWNIIPINGGEVIKNGDVSFNPGKNGQIYGGFSRSLFNEFAEGIAQKSNKNIANTLEDAMLTTSTIIYGDMAFRSGTQLSIDSKTLNVLNNPKVEDLILRKYRAPYKHPFLA